MVQLLGRSLALILQRQLLYSLRSAINRQGTYHRDNQELYSSSHFINTRLVRRESELPLLLGSKYTERQKDRQRDSDRMPKIEYVCGGRKVYYPQNVLAITLNLTPIIVCVFIAVGPMLLLILVTYQVDLIRKLQLVSWPVLPYRSNIAHNMHFILSY